MNQDIRNDIDDWVKDFYITMPENLSVIQQEIFENIISYLLSQEGQKLLQQKPKQPVIIIMRLKKII